MDYINQLKATVLKCSREAKKKIYHYISLITYDSRNVKLELEMVSLKKVDINNLKDRFKSDSKNDNCDF